MKKSIIKMSGFLCATIYKKILNGSRLKLKGIQCFKHNTKIIIRQGQIIIGKRLRVNDRVSLSAIYGGKMYIGDNVSFNRNCILVCRDSIKIGNNCRFGPNVVVYDHDHKFNEEGVQPGFKTGEICIEDGCWIGAGVTILRNTHIGAGSVIGAGTIVKGEIPPHSLVTSDRTMVITPIGVQKL